jgi:flagellar biosynthesis/type III secretory pathway protein FliH
MPLSIVESKPLSIVSSEPTDEPSFGDLLSKGDVWGAVNKPITTAPTEVAKSTMEPVIDWGEKHPGMLGNIARYGGTFGESLGNVASGLTSPLNLALTLGTLGSGTAAKMGAADLAKTLALPGKVAAGGQLAHGAYDVYSGKDWQQKAMGGVEGLLGYLGLKGGFGGKTSSTPGSEYVVEPTSQTGPGTNVLTGATGSRQAKIAPVRAPRPIPASEPAVAPIGPSIKGSGEIPYAPPEPAPYRAAARRTIAEEAKAAREAVKAAAAREKAQSIDQLMQEYQDPEAAAAAAEEAKRFGLAKTGQAINANAELASSSTEPPTPSTPITPSIPDLMDQFQTSQSGRPADFNWPEAGGRYTTNAEGSTVQATPAPTVRNIPENVVPISNEMPLGDRISPLAEGPPQTPESIAAAKTARDAELEAMAAPQAKAIDEAAAQDARNKFKLLFSEPLTPNNPPEPAPIAPRGTGGLWDTQPEVQATADQLGEAYRGGDKLAGRQLAELRDFMSGNKMRESWKGAEPPAMADPLPSPEAQAPPENWAQEETGKIDAGVYDRYKKIKDNESGAINPALLSFLGRTGAGALGGGLLGAGTGHPIAGALAGALGGAIAPQFAPSMTKLAKTMPETREPLLNALNKANILHNATLLSPTSVIKKAGGDIGGLFTAATMQPEARSALWNALTTPEGQASAGAAFKEAFNAPLPEKATGMENIAQRGPLSWAGRTMGGLTAATKDIMGQAGLSPEQQAYYTLTSEPATKLGKGMLQAARSSKVVQHVAPFARLAINRLERGGEFSPLAPFYAMMTENPEAAKTAIKRGFLGTGAGLAAYAATPEDFVKEHPALTGLIAAGGGPLSVPIGAAMAMKTSAKSPTAEIAKTISRDVPGLRLIEDISTSPTAALRNYLSGYTNIARPIATTLQPEEPVVSGEGSSVFDKALSNIPGVREQLPKKPLTTARPRPRLRIVD